MKNKKAILRMVLSLAMMVCLLIISTPAFAFQYTGYHWDTDTVDYDVSSLPSSWQSNINSAAAEWNGAGAEFTFSNSSSSSNDITRGYHGDELWLAETSIYANYPHIYEVDTEFNTRYSWYTDGNDYYVQSTATHELGHWLMLEHTWSSTDAIMYYSYNGETELTQDDINGIIHIYGED